MKYSKHILSGAFLISLSACQTLPYQGEARNVKKKPMQSGVVSIPSNYRPEDRTKADTVMKDNCGILPIKILEEGEIAVGQVTKSNNSTTDRASTERKQGSLFGIPLMSGQAAGTEVESSAVTKQITEWQISYECEKPATIIKK